jgi:hypothetical protein
MRLPPPTARLCLHRDVTQTIRMALVEEDPGQVPVAHMEESDSAITIAGHFTLSGYLVDLTQ